MRRVLFLLIAAAMLSGCSISNQARKTEVRFSDFRPYSTRGFYFLTGPYNGPFIPLGILSIEVSPALSAASGYEKISGAELIETAYAEARKIGANGITDFKITTDHTGALRYLISGTLILITEMEDSNGDRD